MEKLDAFYPIFDSYNWLERMLPLGVKLVQLRVKDKPIDYVRKQIKRSKKLCDDFQCQLIVNDYWQLAIEENCDFIHLGQEDLDTADMEQISSSGVRLGISTHSLEELNRALKYQPDYIALGPIYPTILKQMEWGPQGLEKVEEWKNLIGDIPLVAIGGMTVEKAKNVFNAGANVVSVVTDITLNSSPESRVKMWLDHTR